MKNRIIIYGIVLVALSFVVMPIVHAEQEKPEEEKDRLLVVPLKAQKGIDQEEAILLTDILSVEIHRSGKFIILNRDDMKAVLSEKEFELAMGCEDNVCLLENVEKLAVNKIITGNIGKLGTKYIVSIRMINEDGENEVMEKETCDCAISDLDKTIEQVAYKFLNYLDGDVVEEEEGRPAEIKAEWSEWQDNMKSAYNEALRRDKDTSLGIRKKASSWKRIIDDFRQDNPYSTEDNRIRRHAKIRLKEYMRLAGKPDKPGMRGVLTNDKRKFQPHTDRPIDERPYSSPRITLRSSYSDLSVSQVHSLTNISIREKGDWGLRGHSTINHSYKKSSINGDKVVTDNATGLMWHLSGADEYMNWKKAQKWVEKLNERGYAGCNDWRLPTLEEASSLLESGMSTGLYIDLIFSNKLEWIWTGDKFSSVDVWIVYFGTIGSVLRFGIDVNGRIRPVRSMSNMDSQHIKDNKEGREKLSGSVFTSKNSNVFHKRNCSKLDTKGNLVEFDSPQEAGKGRRLAL